MLVIQMQILAVGHGARIGIPSLGLVHLLVAALDQFALVLDGIVIFVAVQWGASFLPFVLVVLIFNIDVFAVLNLLIILQI